jgi:K+ transporter
MVVVLKFHEGGWLTLFITGTLVAVAVVIKRHYSRTGRQLRRLNSLVELEQMEAVDGMAAPPKKKEAPGFDPKGETAVLFVNGFSAWVCTAFLDYQAFQGVIQKFVFLQVGLIDSGVSRGRERSRR